MVARVLLVSIVLVCTAVVAVAVAERPWVPKDGFVPDANTAIRIAEAVWLPIYGEKQITSEKPFKATLRGDVWTVTGTLPAGHLGGVAEAEISKRDGRIVRVVHTQ